VATLTFDPPSPCIGTCRLDDAGQTCLGCRRTLAEIAAWPSLSARDKAAVLEAIARRQ
jgi:predicted Fe-S protein YdhL (DUF1289 family)